MLKGPFRTDRKFIRFMNENVVHLIRFEGEKHKTVKVKVRGRLVERDYYLPAFTAAELEVIGEDAVRRLRDESAPREYRLPRVEIWTAGRKLLFAYGPGSRTIPTKRIMAAVRAARRKLGPGMGRKLYRRAVARLAQAERAAEEGRREAAGGRLDQLARLQGLTPAFRAEIERRRRALAHP